MKLKAAPKDFKIKKPIHKPYKSTQSGKEGMVYIKSKDGKPRLLHFGDSKMGQHPDDPKRKASYCARSAGIKDKSGKKTKDNKNSPNYWSRLMWKC